MGKGEVTRNTILEHATQLASRLGLDGLSIGRLAGDLELSKSGVFAHFQSKEALQIQVLEYAREHFVGTVIAPALRQPRGEQRIRALFDNWIAWGNSDWLPGGCIFVAAAIELDDQPGPVRDTLFQIQKDWFDTMAQAARAAVEAKYFRPDTDADQFAFEMYGIVLGFHHTLRLLRDPAAEKRVRLAFERLLRQTSLGRQPSQAS